MFHVVFCILSLVNYIKAVVDQLPLFGKRELICLLLFTCNYVVSVGEVSSSPGCLGWAMLFYCGTPTAFHIISLLLFSRNNAVVILVKVLLNTTFSGIRLTQSFLHERSIALRVCIRKSFFNISLGSYRIHGYTVGSYVR